MRLRVVVAIVLLFNLPWVLLWWYFTQPAGLVRGWTGPALFIVLLLGTLGLVGTPCLLVRGLVRKRWLLITMLLFVNLFWALQWIQSYIVAVPGDATYPSARMMYASMMIIYSAVVCGLYWIVGRLMGAVVKRLASVKGWGWNEGVEKP